MNNIFSSIMSKKPQKSAFNLSHARKFSFAPGKLYPTMCQEVLPGDKWSYDTNALVRFQPLVHPMMHLVDVYSYSFFQPARLTMKRGEFEVFITGGAKGDGKNAQGYVVEIPHAMFNQFGPDTALGFGADLHLIEGTLADFLGIAYTGEGSDSSIPINMMPFIAWWRMWNDFFRDQNLHPDYVGLYPGIFDATGDITAAIYAAMTSPNVNERFPFFDIPRVCWEKDMFMSALPFAQRGNPVETPLSGSATVVYKPVATVTGAAAGTATQQLGVRDGTNNINRDSAGTFDDPGNDTGVENIDEVNVDTGGFSINALRLAARLQEWLEKMARGGARYIEQIKSHFGVTSSDARLQRTEYLGGGKIPVSISEVLQTQENGTTPLGEMAGHGVSAGKVTGWSKFFEEHGFVISVYFLRPRTAYQNGTPRLFTHRFDKLDWAWPSFAHLGEQEVTMGELYFGIDDSEISGNKEVFGYQQRYAEYKYIPSTVHGEFKTTLAPWHWGIILESRPTLSRQFVECNPSSRVFNVISEGEPLYAIVSNRITAVRPLPYYGEPSL